MFKRGASAGMAVALAVFAGACTKARKQDPLNTLYIPVQEKIKGLDPLKADDLYAGDEVSHAYEGLLQYHHLKRPETLVPALAEALPEVSKDGKTYVFRLKKGVLFQDDPCFKETGGKGRELTAEDFVYSWKRVADPKNSSPGFWIFDGKIAGINDWRDAAVKAGATDYAKPIEGLKALDRYTLQITLSQRSTQFPYFLAMSFADVVPKEAVDAYGTAFPNHPVGTGPYRLTDSIPGSKYIWDKNPTYRREVYPSDGMPGDREAGFLADAGKPLPLNDRIITTAIEESQPRWLSFMAGKVDIADIPKDYYGQAVGANKEISPDFAKRGIRLAKMLQTDTTFEAFNMLDPVVGGYTPKARMVRQAISLALDHEPCIELFYNGRAINAEGPIPPSLTGYDPAFRNPYRHANLARAKDLLAKAGYPGGEGLPPIVYLSTSSSTDRQMMELFTKMLAQIGVQTDVRMSSWPEFNAAIKAGKGQMWGMAWTADYPDAENFLQLLYSKNARPGPNDAAYSSPEFDHLYEKALTLPDGPERTKIYQQMVHIAAEDAPWVFGVHRLVYAVVQPWVKNYKFDLFDHSRFNYVRVDPTLKN